MNLYLWLSSFYLQKPSIQQLRALLHRDTLSSIGEVFLSLAPGDFRQLKEKAANLDHSLANEIGDEYDRLFVVPSPGSYVPPYGSCFLERDQTNAGRYGELWGKSTLDVQAFYRKAKFEARTDSATPPDHLGVELSFLATLCSEEAAALQEKNHAKAEEVRRLQASFLRDHLLKWIAVFRRDIERSPSSFFYKHIAALTEAFLLSDSDYLQNAAADFEESKPSS